MKQPLLLLALLSIYSASFSQNYNNRINTDQWYDYKDLMNDSKESLLEQEILYFEELEQNHKTKGDNSFVTESDSLALVALYNSTDGNNWTDNTNWLTGPVYSWYGIEVNSGRVTSIEFFNNNLSGSLPSDIEDLSSLSKLKLEFNPLNGEIPNELYSLSSLTYLSLYVNEFSGSISSNIANLTNLEHLDLKGNNFTGNIPTEITNLPKLEWLNLSSNELSGGILSDFEKLVNLKRLDLGYNNFTGEIPVEITYLDSLEEVSLNSNELTGTIPSEFESLQKLENLDLSWNQLSGAIPSELGNISSLKRLTLASNQLTGSIPPEIGNLANLESFSIDRNQIEGTIPSELGNLSSLKFLGLGYNLLHGSVPNELYNLINLYSLGLHDNQLTGSISSEISKLINLEGLHISNNNFSGTLPSEIGNLTLLDAISIHNNSFTGPVPTSFNILVNLRAFHISNNELDSLPNLSSCTKLQNVSFYNCKFSFDDFNNTGIDYTTLNDFYYWSQDSLEVSILDTTINPCSALTINCQDFIVKSMRSSNNEYAFYYKDELVKDWSNDPFFTDPSISVNENGNYFIHVRNSDYPHLTLYSQPIKAKVNNSQPTNLTISTTTISENLEEGSDLAKFSTTDTDECDSYRYTIADGDGTNDIDNDLFRISGGNLINKEILSFEDKPEYKIYVRTIDGGGLTFEKAFIITVTDANDSPSEITISKDSVDENVPLGTTIGQFSTSDEDAGDSHTYSLISGNGTNDADNASFTIDGNNLKTSTELDYETKSEYRIYMQTKDQGGLTFAKEFIINVNDVTVNEVENIPAESFSVYPNPSSGKFIIEFDASEYQVKVYDIGGSLVYNQIATSPKHEIDLSEYGIGQYIISLLYKDKVISKKLILK